MSTEKPILNALAVSVILNRKDQPEQIAWTEWRDAIVLVGGTPAQAGNLALLGPNGQFDPSVIPGGSGGSTVSVNGTLVTNPNFNGTTPAAPGGYANVIWQFDGSGNVSAYYQTTSASTSFSGITSGVNTTATMTVGSGATLTFSGTGVVNANQIYGVAVNSTPPTPGQVLTATSPTTAQWNTPASSSGNFLQVMVDFGFSAGLEGDIARTTVTGQPWVTSSSVILCNPFAGTTPDHSPDDTIVEGLVAYAENLVPGVGFDVVAYAPQNSWGRYLVNVTGQ